MHRAQILLEETQFRLLQRLAVRERKSLSRLLREWVAEKLGRMTKGRAEPLDAAAGMLRGQLKAGVDVRRLDEALYTKDW